jgi:methionyl-tRNA formyltransferase
MSQLIVCGEGHGVECIYNGLHQQGVPFVLCTPEGSLAIQARKDGIQVSESYLEAISSPEDIVLTAAYKPKIPSEHLAKCRFINVHYALLPRYRGMHAIVWSILNGEKEVGFTIHETSALLDQGPVIHQQRIPIANRTSWQLMEEIDGLVGNCITQVVQDYRDGKLAPTPQDEAGAIFVAPRNREDCRVDWTTWDAAFFNRALQALVPPYPRPFFDFKGKLVEIEKAEVVSRDYREILGHVVYVDECSVWIKIPGGLLRSYLFIVDGVSVAAPQILRSIGIRLVPQR